MAHASPTDLLAALYTAGVHAYDRLWSPVIRPMAARLVTAMATPLATATMVLDAGTGSGALLPVIRAAAPGASIVGIDRAEGMLRHARSVSPRTPLALMDAEQLAFRPSAFDAALLAFVLFHLTDPARGLMEVGRVLRPGGVLGTTTWGANQTPPASEIWDEELDARGARPEILPEAVRQHQRMDSPEKVGGLLEVAGVQAIRVWPETFERHWTAPELFELRSGCGIHKRRLDTLDEAVRGPCLERIRARMARLAPADLVWRPEIVIALGRRPS